jgi:hypothetical protein
MTMTDRYNRITVVLDRDIRDDDAEPLLKAILMLRGVLSVEPHVVGVESVVAEMRAKSELREKLLDVLR